MREREEGGERNVKYRRGNERERRGRGKRERERERNYRS